MTTLHWLRPLLLRVAGSDPKVRRHLGWHAAAGVLYLTTAGVMAHAAWFGVVDTGVLQLLTGLMLANFITFGALIRSGWSQRFDDPVLTLPHAMVSLVIIVLAYVLIGDYRGDVIILLAQTLTVSIFRLHPRENLFLGAWAVTVLTVAQFGLAWGHAPGFSLERATAHFAVSATALMALSVVGAWISRLRQHAVRQADELRRTLAQAQSLATTDMLTGLLNRRSMAEALEREMSRAARFGRPLCVALLDIDHFKRVNDAHGHRTGDDVLRAFAALASRELRQADTLARWGGEEFLLLMPGVEPDQAWMALERLRGQVAAQALGDDGRLHVSISAGIARWRSGESLDQWLDRADQALYAAKGGGRNQCRLAEGDVRDPAALMPSAAPLAEPSHP